MIWIGLAAVGAFALIVLYAALRISAAGYEDKVSAQCTPSRQQTYTAYPPRRLRWIGLERSLKERQLVSLELRDH